MKTITVIVTHAMRQHGQSCAPGDVLHLAPLDAAYAVASGRARLSDEADRPALNAAVREEDARTLAALGRSPLERHGASWLRK